MYSMRSVPLKNNLRRSSGVIPGRIKSASLALLLSGVLIILVVIQLGQIAVSDASGLSLPRANLLIFPVIWLLGSLLFFVDSKKFLIDILSLLIIISFIIYVSFVFLIKNNIDIIAFLLSRHSMPVWLMTGLSLGLALSHIQQDLNIASGRAPLVVLTISLVFSVVSLNYHGYLIYTNVVSSLRIITDTSYQSAGAAGAKLIWLTQILLLLCSLEIPRMKYLMFTVTLFSSLVFTVCLFLGGSALIVAFFGCNLLVLVACMVDKRPAYSIAKIVIVAAVLVAILQMNLDVLAVFFKGTRFEAIGDGILTISSIETRLAGFTEFFNQLDVDPIIGNYDSHNVAGSGDGWYIHSVLLSLFTHAGIIGFTLFIIPLSLILRRLLVLSRLGRSLQYHSFFSVLAVFSLGSLTAFFTWTPLWFVMGFCLVGERKQSDRNTAAFVDAEPA